MLRVPPLSRTLILSIAIEWSLGQKPTVDDEGGA